MRDFAMAASIALVAAGCGGKPVPCVPSGGQDVFARMSASTITDTGGAGCAVELSGTLNFSSETSAHLVLDGVLDQDCAVKVDREMFPGECVFQLACGAVTASGRFWPADGLTEGGLFRNSNRCAYQWAATGATP